MKTPSRLTQAANYSKRKNKKGFKSDTFGDRGKYKCVCGKRFKFSYQLGGHKSRSICKRLGDKNSSKAELGSNQHNFVELQVD